MLKDLACSYAIVGHSERRTHFGETDERVNLKAKALLAEGLRPIVCVGETLDQREAGQAEAVVREQVQASLDGIGEAWTNTVIAYEPVWAIGTGETATPEQAEAVHRGIRVTLAGLFGDEVATATRILYGGSVKPGNAADLFSQGNIDGGLIGGASLDAGSFLEIVRAG
jgi:triosephosphate isomerase